MRSMGGEGVGCRELSSADAVAAGRDGLQRAGRQHRQAGAQVSPMRSMLPGPRVH